MQTVSLFFVVAVLEINFVGIQSGMWAKAGNLANWECAEANDDYPEFHSMLTTSLRIAATQYYLSDFFLIFLITPQFQILDKTG